MVLGRLAIHRGHQQRGIGTALPRDAIGRTLQAADIAGMTALRVHAISEDARRFYLSRSFLPSAIQPMTLAPPLATAPSARHVTDAPGRGPLAGRQGVTWRFQP